MAAALLRSTVGLVLRRAASAPASSSRLYSSAAGANTRTTRTYYGYGSRYDAQGYTKEFFPPSKIDKADGYFSFAAAAGAILFVALMDGEYRCWSRPNISSPARPITMRGP